MSAKDFLGDLRYVDLQPLLSAVRMSNTSARTTLKMAEPVLRHSLQAYARDCDDLEAYERLIFDRYTQYLLFYLFDNAANMFIVHLGAVKAVCKVLRIPYPAKSIIIRLQCIERPEVHLRDLHFPVNPTMTDRLTLQTQNLESLLRKMTTDIETTETDTLMHLRLMTVRDILAAEHNIQLAKLAAYLSA